MRKPLTKKEEQFFDKFYCYYLSRLKMPTREELGRYMKASPQVVQYYLNILREKGWIPKETKK